MRDLPPEILAEILSRLPAEDLLHLKCVRKLWANLMNNKHFIKLHLKRTNLSRNNRSLLISVNYNIFSANLETKRVTKLDFPLNFKCSNPGYYPNIIGTCDGLLCYLLGYPYKDYKHDVLVWNMMTKEYLKLPSSYSVYGRPDYFVVYGFGHDFERDDYKVVRIFRFHALNLENITEVYSLRDKSWKTIVASCPHFLMYSDRSGVPVNGALHWVVSRKPVLEAECLVIAFDLSTEDYKEVSLPDYPAHQYPNLTPQFSVTGLEGKLCLVIDYVGFHVDLWVMAEYGNKDSWYKLASLVKPQIISYLGRVEPLAISKSNSRILLREHPERFFWYDIEKDEDRDLVIQGVEIIPSSRWGICLSSLVKLDDQGYSKVSKSENWKEEKSKRTAQRHGNEGNSGQLSGIVYIPRVNVYRGNPVRNGDYFRQDGILMVLPNSLEELKNSAGELLKFGTTDLMFINEAGGVIDSIKMIKDDDTLFMIEESKRRVQREGNEDNVGQTSGGVYIPRVRVLRGQISRNWAPKMQDGKLVRLPNSLEEFKNIAGEMLGFRTKNLMIINEARAVIDSIEMIKDGDTLVIVEQFKRTAQRHGNEGSSGQLTGIVYSPRVNVYRGNPLRNGDYFMQDGILMLIPNSLEELKNSAGKMLKFGTTDLMFINEAGGVIESIEMIKDDDIVFMVEESKSVNEVMKIEQEAEAPTCVSWLIRSIGCGKGGWQWKRERKKTENEKTVKEAT